MSYIFYPNQPQYYDLGKRILDSQTVRTQKNLPKDNVSLIKQRPKTTKTYKGLYGSGLLGMTKRFVNSCEILAANSTNVYIMSPDGAVYVTAGMDYEGIIYGEMIDNDIALVNKLVLHRFNITKKGKSEAEKRAKLGERPKRAKLRMSSKVNISIEEAIISIKNTGSIVAKGSDMDIHHDSYTFDARIDYIKCLTKRQHKAYHQQCGHSSHQVPMILDEGDTVPAFK